MAAVARAPSLPPAPFGLTVRGFEGVTSWTTSIIHRTSLCGFKIEIELCGAPARWSLTIWDTDDLIVFSGGEPFDPTSNDLGLDAVKNTAVREVTRLDTIDI